MPEVFLVLLCDRRAYFSSLENWKKTLWINSISGSFSLHRREHISCLGINKIHCGGWEKYFCHENGVFPAQKRKFADFFKLF
jgi:hypothetical protein